MYAWERVFVCLPNQNNKQLECHSTSKIHDPCLDCLKLDRCSCPNPCTLHFESRVNVGCLDSVEKSKFESKSPGIQREHQQTKTVKLGRYLGLLNMSERQHIISLDNIVISQFKLYRLKYDSNKRYTVKSRQSLSCSFNFMFTEI